MITDLEAGKKLGQQFVSRLYEYKNNLINIINNVLDDSGDVRKNIDDTLLEKYNYNETMNFFAHTYKTDTVYVDLIVQKAYNSRLIDVNDIKESPIKEKIINGYFNMYEESYEELNDIEQQYLIMVSDLLDEKEMLEKNIFTSMEELLQIKQSCLRKLNVKTIDEALAKALYNDLIDEYAKY